MFVFPYLLIWGVENLCVYFYEVRIKWVKMLLDPAISGAIAADRVAWMALAKFNTGGQLWRAPPHVSLSPSLPTYHHPPPRGRTAHYTPHVRCKDKDKETTCLFPSLPPPTTRRQDHFRPFWALWSNLGPLGHSGPSGLLSPPGANLGPLGQSRWRAQNSPGGPEWPFWAKNGPAV